MCTSMVRKPAPGEIHERCFLIPALFCFAPIGFAFAAGARPGGCLKGAIVGEMVATSWDMVELERPLVRLWHASAEDLRSRKWVRWPLWLRTAWWKRRAQGR